jgi:hypothetical protein
VGPLRRQFRYFLLHQLIQLVLLDLVDLLRHQFRYFLLYQLIQLVLLDPEYPGDLLHHRLILHLLIRFGQ